MSNSRLTEYKVGIFVVIATLITLGFIMILGGNKAFFKRTETLHLHTEDTEGLAVGGIVQVSGVPCGNVQSITFDEKSNQLDISLKIEASSMARITQGSVAGIHTQGALGDKYVSIKPGPHGNPPLKNDDVLEAEPNSDLLSTLGKSGNHVEKAFAIVDEVQKMIHAMNEGKLSANLAETARNSKSATDSLNQLLLVMKNKKTFDHLASIFEKIDNGQGTIGGLINDPTVHEDIKDILGGAKRSKLLKYLIRQAIQKNDEGEAADKESNKPAPAK